MKGCSHRDIWLKTSSLLASPLNVTVDDMPKLEVTATAYEMERATEGKRQREGERENYLEKLHTVETKK